MDLITALGALDADDDDHWTSNGLPRVDVLKEMTGNDEITRSMIDDVAPDYVRSDRYDLSDDGGDEVQTEEQEGKAAGGDDDQEADAHQDEDEPEPAGDDPDPESVEHDKQVDEAGRILDRIEKLEAEIDQLRADADRARDKITERSQALEHARTLLTHYHRPPTQAGAVKAYQESAMRERQAIASRANASAQQLGLGALSSRVGMSPLDTAMALRRGSGRSRRRSPQTLAKPKA